MVGNIWVYMDNNHVSATYMRTMAPIVEQQIDTALSYLTQ